VVIVYQTLSIKYITVFFDVDNIDFLEDAAYGQHTLHHCLIVVYQEDSENAKHSR